MWQDNSNNSNKHPFAHQKNETFHLLYSPAVMSTWSGCYRMHGFMLTAGSMDLDRFIGADEGVGALLTDTLLPTESHSVSNGERLPVAKGKKKKN